MLPIVRVSKQNGEGWSQNVNYFTYKNSATKILHKSEIYSVVLQETVELVLKIHSHS